MTPRPGIIGVVLLAAVGASCARCGGNQADQPTTRGAGSSDPGLAASRPAPRSMPALPPVPTGPLTPADTATCDVSESLLKRIACIASLAQRNRDPRYCERVAQLSKQASPQEPEVVRSGAAANSCHRSIAFLRDDPSMCGQISDPAMAGSCLSYFAMKYRDAKMCEQAAGEAAQTCFLNEAARTRDPALCPRTGKFQSDCEKRLGPVGP